MSTEVPVNDKIDKVAEFELIASRIQQLHMSHPQVYQNSVLNTTPGIIMKGDYRDHASRSAALEMSSITYRCAFDTFHQMDTAASCFLMKFMYLTLLPLIQFTACKFLQLVLDGNFFVYIKIIN